MKVADAIRFIVKLKDQTHPSTQITQRKLLKMSPDKEVDLVTCFGGSRPEVYLNRTFKIKNNEELLQNKRSKSSTNEC